MIINKCVLLKTPLTDDYENVFFQSSYEEYNDKYLHDLFVLNKLIRLYENVEIPLVNKSVIYGNEIVVDLNVTFDYYNYCVLVSNNSIYFYFINNITSNNSIHSYKFHLRMDMWNTYSYYLRNEFHTQYVRHNLTKWNIVKTDTARLINRHVYKDYIQKNSINEFDFNQPYSILWAVVSLKSKVTLTHSSQGDNIEVTSSVGEFGVNFSDGVYVYAPLILFREFESYEFKKEGFSKAVAYCDDFSGALNFPLNTLFDSINDATDINVISVTHNPPFSWDLEEKYDEYYKKNYYHITVHASVGSVHADGTPLLSNVITGTTIKYNSFLYEWNVDDKCDMNLEDYQSLSHRYYGEEEYKRLHSICKFRPFREPFIKIGNDTLTFDYNVNLTRVLFFIIPTPHGTRYTYEVYGNHVEDNSYVEKKIVSANKSFGCVNHDNNLQFRVDSSDIFMRNNSEAILQSYVNNNIMANSKRINSLISLASTPTNFAAQGVASFAKENISIYAEETTTKNAINARVKDQENAADTLNSFSSSPINNAPFLDRVLFGYKVSPNDENFVDSMAYHNANGYESDLFSTFPPPKEMQNHYFDYIKLKNVISLNSVPMDVNKFFKKVLERGVRLWHIDWMEPGGEINNFYTNVSNINTSLLYYFGGKK